MLDNISLGLWVCFGALAAASISDMRTREVPDWLNYSLAVFAIGYGFMLSAFYENIWFLVNSVVGFAIGLAVGLLMFYTGQWGGGDSKLVIGICAVLGFSIPHFSQVGESQAVWLFLVNTLVIGAIYGLGYTLILAIANLKKFKDAAKLKLGTKKMIFARTAIMCLLIVSIICQLLLQTTASAAVLVMSVGIAFCFYASIMISCVEKVNMIKEIKTTELTEGDWIIMPVLKGNKTILEPTKTGVSLEEIALLKNNDIKKVTIKIGIPFVPSFLFAFAATVLAGNWLLYLI